MIVLYLCGIVDNNKHSVMNIRSLLYVIVLAIPELLFVCCSNGNEHRLQVDRICVATMNVDGLPVSIPLGDYGNLIKELVPSFPIEIDEDNNMIVNPGGPGAEGSRRIGKKIREKNWDVFGLNEDFNYHDEIWSSLDGYSMGRYMGRFEGELGDIFQKVLLNKRLFDIDGLEFGAKSQYKVSGEVIRPWIPEAVYGYLTNSQDSLTMKGFRYYQVRLDEQATVDFIVLHADAGMYKEDIKAREAAFGQLYDFIAKEIVTDNPLVIMGDFNCFYKRDRLKELFIDRLNAADDLVAGDAWVEKNNGNVYPACGQESADDDHMDVTEKSEMLDKIIYVNRKNAPIKLRLESVSNVLGFTDEDGKQLSDHHPIEAAFAVERK